MIVVVRIAKIMIVVTIFIGIRIVRDNNNEKKLFCRMGWLELKK